MAANMKAGSESAKRQSKRRREMQRRSWRKHAQRTLAGGSAMLSLMAAGVVQAAPQGEQVVHGQATFDRVGGLTTITADNNTIINFSSFNIEAAETVQFVQPSAMARVLSRIQSAAPTNIDGGLLANGRVYIFNPAGVIFGQGAVVNVGALQAAAGNISNEDFLNEINNITQVNGQVVNYGSIQANTIALIGQQVANHGTLDASGGTVSLGAGDAFGLAIHNSGLIRAAAVNIDGGASGMVHIDGTIDASNDVGTGGSVTIGGAEVAMTGSIDVSGSDGGGSVRIGGGFQGGDADVRNATNTFVSGQIDADATDNGDGGTVIVWADGATQFEGVITARGGGAGGDGGFVEVSGAGALGFSGTADLTAANGEGGNLLLDPTDFTVSLAASTATMTFGAGSFTDVVATPSNLNTGDLVTQLNLSNVLLDTTSGLGDTGDVTFQNNVAWNSGFDLSVDADGTITVNLGVTLTNDGSGGIDFAAPNAAVALNGVISLNSGGFQAGDPNGTLLGTTFSMGAASAIITGGGAVDIGSAGIATIGGAGIANAGAVDIRGDGGINLDSNITTSDAVIRLRNAATLTSNSSISSGAGAGNVTFDSTVDGGFDLSVTAGTGVATFTGALGTGTALGSFTVVSADDVNLANIGTGGAAGVTGNTSVTVTDDLFFSGTNYNANQQTYSAGPATHEVSGATTWTSSGDLISFAGGPLNMAAGASITINSSGGNVTTQAITGDGGTAGAVAINAVAGQVSVGQVGGNGAGSSGVASFVATGDAGIVASGSITTDGGIIDLNSTGTVQLGGNLDSTDAGAANAAAITLDGNTTLSSTITIRTDGVADAGVTITNTLDGTTGGVEGLTIDAGTGAVAINNNVGNSIALEGFTVQSGTFTTNVSGSIDTSGATGINVDASGAISTGAVLLSNGNPIVLDSDSTVTVGAAVTAGAGAITFVSGATGNASDVDLNAAVSGSSTVTFKPSLVATGISIGGAGSNAGDMNVDTTSIGNLAEGFSEIIVGSATQADTIVVQASETWLDSIHLNAGAGEINVANAIDTTSSANVANVTLSGDGTTTTLAADITTTAGAVTINDSVLLNGTITIDTTNAGTGSGAGVVTITGAIDGVNGNADTFTIDATDGGGNANVNLAGAYGTNAVGGSAALTGDLIITGDTVDLAVVSVDTGVISVTGVTRTDLNGASYSTTASGAITFTGAVDLPGGSDVVVKTPGGGGDDILFNNTLDASGGRAVFLGATAASGGNITVTGNAGGINALGGFVVERGAQVDVANIISDGSVAAIVFGNTGAITNIDLNGTTYTNTGGDFTVTFGTVDLDAGGAITVTSGGAAGEDISFGTTVDGAQQLILEGGAAGDVTFGAAVGGGTALTGFDVNTAENVSLQAVTTNNGIIQVGNNAGDRVTQLTLNNDLTSHSGGNAGAIALHADDTILEAAGSGTITIDSNGTADSTITLTTDASTLRSSTAWEDGLTLDAGTSTVDISGATLAQLDHLDITAASGTFGALTLGDGVGNGGVGLDLNTTGNVTFTGDISTAGDSSNNAGAIDLAGIGGSIILDDVNGDSNISITTDVSGTDAVITIGVAINGTSAGAEGLTIDAGIEDVTLSSTLGAVTRIGALSVSGNDLNIDGAIEATSITMAGREGGDADSIDLAAVAFDANTGNMSFASDDIIIAGGATLLSTGGGTSVTFTAEAAATSIAVGSAAAGTLALSEAELQTVQNSFTEIIIGVDTTQSGLIDVNDAGGLTGLNTGLRLRSEAGDIDINSAIDLTNDAGAAFTIEGQGDTTLLTGDITTDGGAITITDTIEVNGTPTLDSGNGGASATAGNITITGNIGADGGANDTLTLDANGATDGNVDVQGNVGSGTVNGGAANDLIGFTVVGAQVDLGNVDVDGGGAVGILITGTTDIDLNGTVYQIVNPAGGNDVITFTGGVTLNANVAVTGGAAAGDTVTFGGAIDSEGGARTLNVQSAAATADFQGAIGAVSALTSLTVNNAAGAGVINLANIGGGAVGVTGGTTIGNAATADLNFNGTIYNANAQTYTAAAGLNLDVVGGGAPVAFTSTDDPIVFASGTVELGNGANLTVTTGGGGVSAVTGIRGTSDETVVLSATGGTTNTVDVGQIGNANEILQVNITGTSGVTLRGDITTSVTGGTGVSIVGDATITPDLTINTSAGNDVIDIDAITGDTPGTGDDLTLNAGTSTVTVGTIGTNAAADTINLLVITGTGGITLNGSASTGEDGGGVDGDVDINGAVTLGADVVVDTTDAGGGQAGNLDFSTTINSDGTSRSLTVTTTGDTATFNGDIGTTTALSNFDVTDASVATLPNIDTNGAAGLGILIGSNSVITQIIIGSTLDATDGDAAANAGDITLNSTNIDIVSATTLDVDDDAGTDGTIMVGTGAGDTFDVSNAGTGNRGLTINVGAGTLTFHSDLGAFNDGDDGFGNLTVTNATGGTMTWNGDITTNGGNVDFTGLNTAVVVTGNDGGAWDITTNTANAALGGDIDFGANAGAAITANAVHLNLDATDTAGAADDGDVRLPATVTLTTGNLDVDGETITVSAITTGGGNVDLNADASDVDPGGDDILFTGTLIDTTNGGTTGAGTIALTSGGSDDTMLLSANLTLRTAGAANDDESVTIGLQLDAAAAQTLTINADDGSGDGDGDVDINAAIGTAGGGELGLVQIDGDQITLGGAMEAAGIRVTGQSSIDIDAAVALDIRGVESYFESASIDNSGGGTVTDSVGGGGSIMTYRPLTAATQFDVGDDVAGTDVSDAAVTAVQNAVGQLQLGHDATQADTASDQSGTINIDGGAGGGLVVNADLVIQADSATLNVTDGIDANANAGQTITVNGANATTNILNTQTWVTNEGQIVINDSVVIAGGAVFTLDTEDDNDDTGAAVSITGNITAGGANADLTIDAGNGNVTLGTDGTDILGDSGGTRFSDVSITTDTPGTVTIHGEIFASTVTIAGDGAAPATATLNDPINLDDGAAADVLDITATNVIFSNDANITTLNSGRVDINGTGAGLIEMPNTPAVQNDLDGSFDVDNMFGALLRIGESIRTSGDAIGIGSPTILTDSIVLDTTNGAAAGNNVTMQIVTGTTAGGEALTIDGGTGGAVTISGQIGGMRLGLLDVREAAAVSFSNNTAATHEVSGLNIGVTDAAVETISILDDVDSTTVAVQMTADAVSGNVISIQGVDSNGQSQTYSSADDIVFGGGAESIESTGNGGDLTIRGTTVAIALGLGTDATSGTAGAGSGVNLTDASIAAIGPGFDGSTINFGTTGQTALVTIEGASHSYDQDVHIYANGGANVNINSNLDTVEGNADSNEIRITGAAGADITLAADLTTDGGQVIITAGQLFVDGGATRTINTGGDNQSATTGGVVDLDGLTDIDGVTSAGRWDILTEGATNGGNIELADVVAAGTGINRIDIDTSGTTAGTVSLSDVRLVYSGAASQFNINDDDATPGNVIVSSTIDLSSATDDEPGGTFDAGVSDIIPATDAVTLTINTSYTGASDGDANEDGGNVILGDVTNNGAGVYFDTVTIDMSTTDAGSAAGTLMFGGVSTAEQADSVIQADGDVTGVAGTPNANDQTEATILISGLLNLPSNSLAIDTNIEDAGIASGAIDIRNLITDGAAHLTLDTSGANNATTAGHVYMGDMGATTPLLSLTVDTRGTGTSGTLFIFDSDGSGTAVVNVDGSGSIDFSNAPRIDLQADTALDTDAAGGATNAGTLDFNNGGTVDGDDQYDLSIDTTADGGGTDAALTVDSNLGGPTAGGTEELQDLIVSAATITISDVVNSEGFQRWSSSSAATININANISSDTDDTGDDFEMQSVGNIIQSDGNTIDVNSGAARIESTSASITLDGGGNGGLTGTGANQALPVVLGASSTSTPRTADGAPGVVYQLEAATDVTSGDIANTGAGNIEVIAGSDSAGGDTGGGATATINVDSISTTVAGIVYMQATNTAANGQILDADAANTNLTAREFHARANDRIGVVETVSDAAGQVYLDKGDTGYNGDPLESTLGNAAQGVLALTTLDADSHISIDNTDGGGGLLVQTLAPGDANAEDATAWIRNSAALDISNLTIANPSLLGTDRLAFIATTGVLTIQNAAMAQDNVTDTTEASGPTIKIEAVAGDIAHAGGAGSTIVVTTVNLIGKSTPPGGGDAQERYNTTVHRADLAVSGVNNDLLVSETDGIDFSDLDSNPTSLSSGDALEIRTNVGVPGGTTNTDFNDITQTTAAGDGITLGNSLSGVAVPAGGFRVTVLDTDGGADAAQFGDLRFGVDATASVDIFGTNATTAIEIDVADGHALFGAASVTVDALGQVTAIGGGVGLDMDANNGDLLVRITASDGVFGSADERQVVFGDSTGVSDVSVTAGSSGSGSGNLYVDNDNNLATNPPDGTGAAGANAGGITVSDDASIEALLNGPPNTATGTLTFKGDINNDGTVSPDSTRTIIFEAGSADITIGVAGLTASGDFTLIPGAGFDVVILDGGFIDVNEDPGISSGNLTIRDAENVDMQGDNSRITADGGIDIGHGQITAGAAGTVTGDIRLNNVIVDFNGNGDGGVGGGVTPGLFVHTTGASLGMAGAGIRGGAIEGIIIIDGVNDLNSNPGGGFLHNLTLQADVGDVIGGTDNAILGVNEVRINAENGVGYDSNGAAVATLNFDAVDFVTVTTDGPGEIQINNTPSGDVTVREFLIDQDANDASSATNEIHYEQNGFDLDIGRPGLGDTGINSDGGLITVDPPVDVAVGAPIVSGGSAVLLEASGDIDFDAGGTITSSGGQVNVQAGGHIDFNIGAGTTTISSGGGGVFVQADFEVIAGSQDAAGTVTFGVAGTASAIIEAGAGNITISGEDIVLHDFATETTGDTFLSAGQLVTSTGTITGTAGNASADITTDGLDIQVINTGGGDVVGTAAIPVDFVATGSVTGGEPIGIDGNVFLDSISGTFTTGNLIADGEQTLTSAGTFAVGQVQGTVISVDSDTDITDADTGTDGGFIGSTSVSLESDTGIGATGEAGSVEIDTPTLTVANNTGGGGIFLNSVGTAAINFTDVDSDGVGAVELRALSATTLTNVDVADGNLTVIVTESPLTSLAAALDDVGNGNDTISLTTTGATGDITLNDVTNHTITTFTADAGDDFALAGAFASTTATTVTISANDDVAFNASFVAAAAALTVNSSNTTTTLNNATVTAATGVYNNATVLGTDVTFTGTSFTFNNTLDATTTGVEGATFAGATNAIFNGVVGGSTNLGELTVGGTTSVNTTDVITSDAGAGNGNQTYTGNVTVSGTTTFDSNGGNILFFEDLLGATGNVTVEVDAAGAVRFGSDHVDGDLVSLQSLEVDGFGIISVVSITTSGSQTYNDDLVLSAGIGAGGSNTTFTAGNDATFFGTIDSAAPPTWGLIVNAAGDTQFHDNIGTTFDRLTALELGGGGRTIFGSGSLGIDDAGAAIEIEIEGASILITDAVILEVDTTINEFGAGDVDFNNTIDSDDGELNELTVGVFSGDLLLGDSVGGSDQIDGALGELTASAETVQLGDSIDTMDVIVEGDINLRDGVTDARTGTTTVTLAVDILNIIAEDDGDVGLADVDVLVGLDHQRTNIETEGSLTSGSIDLSNVGTDGELRVTIDLDGDGLETATIGDGVTAIGDGVGGSGAGDATLTGGDDDVIVLSGSTTVSGILTANIGDAGTPGTDGVIDIDGNVAAASIAITGGTDSQLQFGIGGASDATTSTIDTTAEQDYDIAVLLEDVDGAVLTATGRFVRFQSTVDARTDGVGGTSDKELTVRTTGAEVLEDDGDTFFQAEVGGNNTTGGDVDGLESLTVDDTAVSGETHINADITTTGASQDYFAPVLLTTDVILTEAGTGDITFHSSLDSDAVATRALTVQLTNAANGSDLNFMGAVGGLSPLTTLTVDTHDASAAAAGGGRVFVTGGSISTTGSQTYDYPVVVSGAATTFSTTADGTGSGTDLIDFRSTLDGTTALSDDVDVVVGNGDIEFGDLFDLASDDVGGTTPLGNLRIVNSGAEVVDNVNFHGTVSANTLYQQDGDGLTRFFDDVMIHTQLTAGDVPGEVLGDEGILIRGTDVRFDGDVDTQGIINGAVGDDTAGMTIEQEGTLDINDDADANTVGGTAFSGTNFMLGGSFLQREGSDAATVTTEGNIFTLGDTAADTVTFNSPFILTNDSADDAIIDTTSNGTNATGANISFVDDGAADPSAILGSARRVNDLVLNAGTAGDIWVDTNVGEDDPQTGAVALRDILVVTANDVTIDNNVYANRVQIGQDSLAINPLSGVAVAAVTGNVSIGEDEGNPSDRGILSTAGLPGSGEAGGIGGIGVDIRADLQITITEVDTSGGTGASPGGDGGSVRIESINRGINIGHRHDIGSGDITASGGDAGAGGGGGAGGDVTLLLDNAIDQGAGSEHLNDVRVTRIDTNGGDASGSDVGGAGGDVTITTITAASNAQVIVTEAITANGGTGTGTGAGGAGGSIDIFTFGINGDVILSDTLPVTISADGGAATGSGAGGAGGTIEIDTVLDSSDIDIDGTVSVDGGASATGDSGSGGAIDITTEGDESTIDIDATVSAQGADATGAGIAGAGGTVSISTGDEGSDSDIDVTGTVQADGGDASGSGAGGAGGEIDIFSEDDDSPIDIDGTVSADGGSSATGVGGAGGDIEIYSELEDSRIDIDGTVRADGGAATAGVAAGGAGGTVDIATEDDGSPLTVDGTVSADGGSSAGGVGGAGGGIEVTTDLDSSPIDIEGTVSADGGAATGGVAAGGAGGGIDIRTFGSSSTINTDATISGDGGNSAGGAGGVGGGIDIITSGSSATITVAAGNTVNADGGDATGGTGAGGIGGSVEISSIGSSADIDVLSDVNARGGSSTGGTGGNGGEADITTTGSSADIFIDGGGVDISGGDSAGGDGGNGGASTINITTTGSSATIETGSDGQVRALGGDGGGAAGDGGDGGVINVTTTGSSASITINAEVEINGGEGSGTGDGGKGGPDFGGGGTVNIGTTGSSASITINDDIRALGGDATGSGDGGNGGDINITTTGSSADIDVNDSIDISGGDSVSGNGGDGDLIEVDTDGEDSSITFSSSAPITANGGSGDAGGDGGEIEINTESDLADIRIDSTVRADGGAGIGSDGGDGGVIWVIGDHDGDGDGLADNVDVSVTDVFADGGDSSGGTGGDGGELQLHAASGVTVEPTFGRYGVPNGILVLRGDLSAMGGTRSGDPTTALGDGGSIELNSFIPRTSNIGVASIVGAETGTLTIDHTGATGTGSTTFGPFESFTSIGRTFSGLLVPTSDVTAGDGGVVFNSNGGTLTFSDMTIDGSLRVFGDTVPGDGVGATVMFNIASGLGGIQNDRNNTADGLFNTNDVLIDQGQDIVVRDSLMFRDVTFGTPTAIGGGDANVDPQFALQDPNKFSLNLMDAGYVVRILPTFRGLFGPSSQVLDHRAELPSITNVAPTFAVDPPAEDWWFQVGDAISPTQAQIDDLQSMGINAVGQPSAQLGLNVFNDLPQALDPQEADYTVSADRMVYDSVEKALKVHQQLMSQESVSGSDLGLMVEALIDTGLTRRELVKATEALINDFQIRGIIAEQIVDTALTPPIAEIEADDIEDSELDAPADDAQTDE